MAEPSDPKQPERPRRRAERFEPPKKEAPKEEARAAEAAPERPRRRRRPPREDTGEFPPPKRRRRPPREDTGEFPPPVRRAPTESGEFPKSARPGTASGEHRAARRRRGGEPSAALQQLVELPLRLRRQGPVVERIEALEDQIAATAPDGPWLSRYDVALDIARDLVAEMGAELSALQEEILSQPDQTRIRNELLAGPQKEADRAASQAKATLSKVSRAWTDRIKRQQDQVSVQCMEPVDRDLVLFEEPTPYGLVLRVDPTWWAQFTGFVGRCCGSWSERVTGGFEAEALRELAGLAGLPLAAGQPVTPPAPRDDPEGEGAPRSAPPFKEIEVPSTGASMMQYMRSNIMTVGILGSVFAGVLALVGPLMGGEDGGGGGGVSTMAVRGGVLAAALPVSLVFGIKAARRQREKLRHKAVVEQKKAVTGHVKSELKGGLDRQRGALDRWVAARATDWERAVDAWFAAAVQPQLDACETRALEAIREQKIKTSRMSERQMQIKQQLRRIEDNLLFDLKKARRALQRGG